MIRLQPIWLCLSVLSGLAAAELPSGFGFVKQYCVSCHSAEQAKGGLDLSRFTHARQLAQEGRLWREVVDVVIEQDMPPSTHKLQPDQAGRRAFAKWVDEKLDAAARANAGDPGDLPLRRLTIAELDHTLADLTGLKVQWTASLPADVSGGEGFTNAAASLRMSALFIEKQMAMAARIASHAELLPSGPLFHPYPVGELTRSQRSHLALQRLDAWYRRHQGLGPLPGQVINTKNSVSIIRDSDLLYSPMTLPVIKARGGAKRHKKKRVPAPSAWVQVKADALWTDLHVIARTPRAKQLALLQEYLLGRTYRPGSDPALEASLKRLGADLEKEKLRDTSVGNAGGKKENFRKGISHITVGALLPYLQGIRPFTAAEQKTLDRFSEAYRDTKDYIKVPHAWAHAEFVHRYFTDDQLQALWEMLCDAGSAFAKDYSSTVPNSKQQQWRQLQQQDIELQKKGLGLQRQQTLDWVERAWRRPLTAAERKILGDRFDHVLAASGSNAALRQIIIQTLSSPHFIYRVEQTIAGSGSRTVGPYELANRLSYFLWSSPPDAELLTHAASGALGDVKVLRQELARMRGSLKINRFASEFFGQWLKFYRFDKRQKTDRERFPEFTTGLQRAMYDEALVFCVDVLANDRPLTDFLSAGHAFLRPELARFYGLPVTKDARTQAKASGKGKKHSAPKTALQSYLAGFPRYDVRSHQRGGITTWASVLTSLSKPLRTSPIRRGTWVLVDVLGVSMPEPPNDVPEIPDDERNAAGLSQRAIMAKHRQDPSCASCHARIDPIGIALESFDAIGRWRRADLNGKPIDSTDTLHDGTRLNGVAGLRAYLTAAPQQDAFVANACKMLLAYALGRSIQLSDEALLQRMQAALAANDYRISVALEQIITSRQFRQRRERDFH